VPGPWISGAIGAADEENGIRIGRDDDGHSGPDQRRVVRGIGMPVGQALSKSGEPAG
jgi:hypothetical protein